MDYQNIKNALTNIECGKYNTLEPRLQEYLKKNIYYQENNIAPCIPVETEFNITDNDIHILKRFIKGKKKNIYNAKNHPLNKQTYNSDTSFFASIKQDAETTKKLKKINDAKNKEYTNPHNMGMFSQSTKNKNKNINNFYDNCLDKNNQMEIFDGRDILQNFEKQKEYIDTFGNSTNNKQHINSEMNHRLYPQNINDRNYQNNLPNNNINNIIGELDKYGETYQYSYNDGTNMDTKHKIIIPSAKYNSKKDINTSSYKSVPYMGYGEGKQNIDVSTSIRDGLPTRSFTEKFKTNGYGNPAEHFFQYINPNIQDPKHVVFPYHQCGESTRLNNKSITNKTYERDIV
jgi:hypothetical protein